MSDDDTKALRGDVEHRVYGMRWLMLALFSFLTFADGMLWMSVSPVSNLAQKYYGVSASGVNLLPTLFFATYIPFAPVAAWVMDHRSLKFSVVVGAILNGVAAVLRFASFGQNEQSFLWLQISASVAGASCPFFLAAPTKMASVWFAERERATATGICVLFNQVGMTAGFFVPPLVVYKEAGEVKGMIELQIIEAVIGSAATLFVLLLFKEAPPTPPSKTASTGKSREGDTTLFQNILMIWKDGLFWALAVTFGVVTGTFWNIFTLLNETMSVHDYTESEIDIAGTIAMVVGIVGMWIAGYLADLTRQFKTLVLVGLGLGCLTFGLYTVYVEREGNLLTICVVCGFLGFAMSSVQPLLLEMAAEVTYPASESASCSILYLLGLAAATIYIQIADATKSEDGSMRTGNIIFTSSVGVVFVIVCFLRPSYKRGVTVITNPDYVSSE